MSKRLKRTLFTGSVILFSGTTVAQFGIPDLPEVEEPGSLTLELPLSHRALEVNAVVVKCDLYDVDGNLVAEQSGSVQLQPTANANTTRREVLTVVFADQNYEGGSANLPGGDSPAAWQTDARYNYARSYSNYANARSYRCEATHAVNTETSGVATFEVVDEAEHRPFARGPSGRPVPRLPWRDLRADVSQRLVVSGDIEWSDLAREESAAPQGNQQAPNNPDAIPRGERERPNFLRR